MSLSIPASWQAWADAALGFLYPEVCQVCHQAPATHGQAYVCAACRADVKAVLPPFCSKCGRPCEGAITVEFTCDNCRELDLQFCWARSAVLARGTVLEAIHKYKYNRQLWFESFLGELLIAGAAESLRGQSWDALVPVPLFPVKEREREFNQAERLARRLGEATGIPVASKVIKRVLHTPSQTRLSRRERTENMRHAFALRRRAEPAGHSYVLIDDVFTTGATTNACARVLLRAGAQRVAVWTLARGV